MRILLVSLLWLLSALVEAQTDTNVLKHGDHWIIEPQVFYDYNKASIRPESYAALDTLGQFLQNYTNLVIEIGVHLDARWNPRYSRRLDQARGNAVRRFLIERWGIAPDRVTAKGYGYLQPLIEDSLVQAMATAQEKEAAHQKNRRTEVKILATNYGIPPSFLLTDTVFKVGAMHTTYRIAFDFGKVGIQETSYAYLDSVVAWLQLYPELQVEVGNHTDYRGNDKYNTKLAEMRAKAVVAYLVGKGSIAAHRLKATGYGETSPLVDAYRIKAMSSEKEQERAHQKNRRTVFIITAIE